MNLLDTPKSKLYSVDKINVRVVSLHETLTEFGIIDEPDAAVKFFRDVVEKDPEYEPDQEQLVVLCLSVRKHLKHWRRVALGTATSVDAHPGDILRPVIVTGAPAFIIMHNHPSGDPSPSEEDIRFTRQLMNASSVMNKRFLDHVVVGRKATDNKGHCSLKELGYFHE